MNDVGRHATHIAAIILQRAGLCKYESIDKCRHVLPADGDCVKCIERWLIQKAKAELQSK